MGQCQVNQCSQRGRSQGYQHDRSRCLALKPLCHRSSKRSWHLCQIFQKEGNSASQCRSRPQAIRGSVFLLVEFSFAFPASAALSQLVSRLVRATPVAALVDGTVPGLVWEGNNPAACIIFPPGDLQQAELCPPTKAARARNACQFPSHLHAPFA